MKQLLAIIAACLVLGVPGASMADRPARSLPGWEAVGRLNIAGRNMCTASLIAPNVVLTAAHCLFDPNTGRRVNPGRIRFEAGLNGSSVKASRTVAKAVLHPQYQFRAGGNAQLGHDIAVLRLQSPISSNEIRPFGMAGAAVQGAQLGVLAYSFRSATRPRLDDSCQVLSRQTRLVVMSCLVEFGASGAPVLRVTPGYPPTIVSVVSTKAAIGRRPVSIATTLDQTLQAMIRSAST